MGALPRPALIGLAGRFASFFACLLDWFGVWEVGPRSEHEPSPYYKEKVARSLWSMCIWLGAWAKIQDSRLGGSDLNSGLWKLKVLGLSFAVM